MNNCKIKFRFSRIISISTHTSCFCSAKSNVSYCCDVLHICIFLTFTLYNYVTAATASVDAGLGGSILVLFYTWVVSSVAFFVFVFYDILKPLLLPPKS